MFLLPLLLTACPLFVGTNVGGTGSVSLSISSSVGVKALSTEDAAKTIMPAASEIALETYYVSGTGPGSATLGTTEFESDEDVSLVDLKPGSWNFTVQGMNSEDELIAEGSVAVTILSGSTVSASVTLLPADGTGTLSVTISLDDVSVTLSDPTLTDSEGTESDLSGEFSTSAPYSLDVDLSSGIYTLTYTLTHANKSLHILDAVQIFSGLTSEKAYEFDEEDFTAPPADPPTALSVSSKGVLTWTDNSSVETGYKVERKDGDASWETLADDLDPNTETYTDSTVRYDSDYSYRVCASNENGDSDPSEEVEFVPVLVTGISVAPTSVTLTEDGSTSTLTVTVSPDGATTDEVTWTSDDTAVAVVNSSGTITPLAYGTTTVHASTVDGGYSATCAVIVLAGAGVSTRLAGTILVSDNYGTYTFDDQSEILVRAVIEDSGTYYLSWADAGEGKTSSSVDALVTLTASNAETVYGSIEDIDSAYLTPVSVSLEAGTYFILMETKDGSTASGSVDLKLYQKNTVSVALYGRITPSEEYSSISFDGQSSLWARLDITAADTYLIQWSDEGEGDGTDTVDVTLSLYDSTKSAIVSSVSGVDDGYSSPVSASLSAGTYWISLDTVSGSTATGSCKLRVRDADITNLSLDYYERLTVAQEFQSVTFKKVKSRILWFTVDEADTYVLRWSDSGEGDGTSTVDITATLLDSTLSSVVGGISAEDSGYLSPQEVSLDVGTYGLELDTKSGLSATGTVKVMVYGLDTGGGLDLDFIGRLTVAPEFSTVTFASVKQKVLAVDVPSTGDYTLTWSDSGEGDNADSLDVLVTLLYEDQSTIVGSCDALDDGYLDPVEFSSLGAGRYYVLLETASGSAESGTMKIKLAAE